MLGKLVKSRMQLCVNVQIPQNLSGPEGEAIFIGMQRRLLIVLYGYIFLLTLFFLRYGRQFYRSTCC